MAEWWLARATYNEEEQTYSVLLEDGQVITYAFVCVDDEEGGFLLALQKSWEEAEEIELYPFRCLADSTGWESIVQKMIAQAQETAPEENVDEFLCLIDIAKHWAIDDELDEDDIEAWEGLFVLGPEDAYTERPYEPNRLHHHVARPDAERWRIGVARAVAADEPTRELGWVCYAIVYPELLPTADETELANAKVAHLLDLEHHVDELGARIAAEQLEKFMWEGERVQNPWYAYINDTEILEFISVLRRAENEHSPEWQILADETLQTLREQGVLTRREWYPRDLFREFAEHVPLSVAQVDQLAALWRDLLGVKPYPFPKDSPFEELD